MSEIGRDLQAEPTEMIDDDAPESEQESWEIAEVVDNAIASGQHSEFMVNEYLYQFKQGGRMIRGLSASMYAHLALVEGITEVTEETKHVEDDEKHEFNVVVMRKDRNTGVEQKAQGFAEEPKQANGKYDKFAKQKAYTKAFRNGAKKLLPFDLILKAIEELAFRQPVANVPVSQPQQQLPPPQQQQEQPKENPVDVARKHMFAKYNEKKGTLLALGITEDIFKEALYKRYEVESRADMTEGDYRNAASSLDVNGGFAKWIMDLVPTTESGGEGEEGEDGMPF